MTHPAPHELSLHVFTDGRPRVWLSPAGEDGVLVYIRAPEAFASALKALVERHAVKETSNDR